MPVIKKQKRLFGTNGVRGVVGEDMTPALALSIGQALGTMRRGHVAVGRDTRTSGDVLSNAVKAGLLAAGCRVADCGVLPTPALQYLVRNHFDAGAMVTASHNPPQYNGIKIIEGDGTEMADDETIMLEERIFDIPFNAESWDKTGTETRQDHLLEEYIAGVAGHFPSKPGKGMTVVADPGSGPACFSTPAVLARLGCRVLTVNGIPDGRFPGRMPEPSPEGLKDLAALVVSSHAAFGVAHDGDADRAVFIDENGNYIEENQEFALIAQHICSGKQGTIVTPVSTSQIVEIVAGMHGSTVTYTPVGSIYVARTMLSLLEQGSTVILGGEGNGGIIFPEHQFCRDGAMTAAMMVSILASAGRPLSSLIGALPKRFLFKEKLTKTNKDRVIATLIAHYPHLRQDTTDGLKLFFGNSWALIRASGTEPILRIIVDSDNYETGNAFCRELLDRIGHME